MALDTATTLALADAGHAAAEHAGGGGLPQFDPTSFSSQVFWLAVVFIVLYTYFARTGLPGIGKTINGRDAQIKDDRDQAEAMARKTESVVEAYEASLTRARVQAASLHAEVDATIKKNVEKSLQMFQEKAEHHIRAAETRFADGKHQAMDEMHTIAAEIAAAAAEKIVGIPTDLNAAKSVVRSVNSKLSKAA